MAKLTFLTLPLLLAGCATMSSPGGGESYRALGTEPFWSVNIDGGQLRYSTPDGNFSDTLLSAEETGDGRIYRSRRFMLQTSLQECSDGMSDRRYRDTVRATVDGNRLEGCGGPSLAPETLADTNWTIVAINGAAVSGDRYQMQFEANRLSGRAGCNSFSGPYSVGSDGLQAGPLMMTRMACPGPAMTHERAVADILRGRVRLYYPDGETLLMRGAAGGEIRLRRVI